MDIATWGNAVRHMDAFRRDTGAEGSTRLGLLGANQRRSRQTLRPCGDNWVAVKEFNLRYQNIVIY